MLSAYFQKPHTPVSYENARKKMELIKTQSLPQCILLIYGYIRISTENGCHKEVVIPKCIVKFILKELNALRSSTELRPFFMTPIEKLPGFKSGVISLIKVVEALSTDEMQQQCAATDNANQSINRALAADDDTKCAVDQPAHNPPVEPPLVMSAAVNALRSAQQHREKLVSTIAKILIKLCDANARYSVTGNAINTPFYGGERIPVCSVHDYLHRFSLYSRCSDDVFIMALIYIDRVIVTRNAMLNIYTVHRYLLSAILSAAKFHDDVHYDNKTYALLGGVSIKELNQLEVQFLFALSFELFIEPQEYQLYVERISNFC